MAELDKSCSASVSRGYWYSGTCQRKAVVERDGKPYCKQHDPENIKIKDAERQAKYQAGCCRQCRYPLKSWFAYCPACGTKRVK